MTMPAHRQSSFSVVPRPMNVYQSSRMGGIMEYTIQTTEMASVVITLGPRTCRATPGQASHQV